MHAKSLQSCLTPWNPMDRGSLPGSSVHGILQARMVFCHALAGNLPNPRIEPYLLRLQLWEAGSFNTSVACEALYNISL